MDWKELHSAIKDFTREYQIQLEASDLSFESGILTTYRLTEKTQLFYEVKQSKPILEHGSKLRIYSSSPQDLSIRVKKGWFGRVSIKSTIEVVDTLSELLVQLAHVVGSFLWITEQHHAGWPSELRDTRTLKFECKHIAGAVSELESIRKIHLILLEKHRNDHA